jgi:hypothetical protein
VCSLGSHWTAPHVKYWDLWDAQNLSFWVTSIVLLYPYNMQHWWWYLVRKGRSQHRLCFPYRFAHQAHHYHLHHP